MCDGRQRWESKAAAPSYGEVVAEVQQVAQRAAPLLVRGAQPFEVHLHVSHRSAVREVVPQQASQTRGGRTPGRDLTEQIAGQSVGGPVLDRSTGPAGGGHNSPAVEGPPGIALAPVERRAVEDSERRQRSGPGPRRRQLGLSDLPALSPPA